MKRTAVGDSRGFTLVELIVCLVIVGILAAIAIPTMLGYTKKAKRLSLTEECYQCVLASQTLGSQTAAAGGRIDASRSAAITALAEVKGTVTSLDWSDTDGVTWLAYTSSALETVIYEKTGKNARYLFPEDGLERTGNDRAYLAVLRGGMESAAFQTALKNSGANLTNLYSGVPNDTSAKNLLFGDANAALFATMPANVQSALKGKTYTIASTSGKSFSSYKILFYSGDLSAASSSKRIQVSVYDSVTGAFGTAMAYPGTVTITNASREKVSYRIISGDNVTYGR